MDQQKNIPDGGLIEQVAKGLRIFTENKWQTWVYGWYVCIQSAYTNIFWLILTASGRPPCTWIQACSDYLVHAYKACMHTKACVSAFISMIILVLRNFSLRKEKLIFFLLFLLKIVFPLPPTIMSVFWLKIPIRVNNVPVSMVSSRYDNWCM